MGDKITLKLDKRELHGKKVAQLRRQSIVPGVVYGPGMEPVSVQVDYNTVAKAYRIAGTHAPIHLDIEGKKRIAMIKEAEVDPTKHLLRHISFHAVKATDPVVAEVPVRLLGEGESAAEKAGLMILQTIEKIEVRALPMDLPDAIEISIAHLVEAGERVTLADATLPEGVSFVEHDDGHHDEDEEKQSVSDMMVASVWEPAALQAQNEATGGDATDESEVESENGEAEATDAPAEEKKED